ncbi:Mediator of DNA damage checkpoint protein 1, partial [Cladochytrium tenue]
VASSPAAVSQLDRAAATAAGRADGSRFRIMFTGIADTADYEMVVATLGGQCVQSWAECTHLVTDKIRRTIKFLSALAAGKHIMSTKWLDASLKSGAFAPETRYILKDTAAEKLYGFSLKDSIARAAAARPFAGLSVYATPNTKPSPDNLAEMLEAAGAKKPSAADTVVVIASPDDRDLCASLGAAGWPLHSTEFVLAGLLRQHLDLAEHLLPADDRPAIKSENVGNPATAATAGSPPQALSSTTPAPSQRRRRGAHG